MDSQPGGICEPQRLDLRAPRKPFQIDAAESLISRLIIGGPLEARVGLVDLAEKNKPMAELGKLTNQAQVSLLICGK